MKMRIDFILILIIFLILFLIIFLILARLLEYSDYLKKC